MTLPFTPAQFFEVFARYNAAVWPAQFALGTLAVASVLLVLLAPARAGRVVAWILALLWAWVGIVYHLAYFAAINPAAPLFAAIALAGAVAFAWIGGVRGRLVFERGSPGRKRFGVVIVVFALLLYPALGAMLGHRYPAAPTFGLPCPTTLFTFGMLLMASDRLPWTLVVAPLIWAFVGATAAIALGVLEDLALLVVAGAGLWLLFRPARALQRRAD